MSNSTFLPDQTQVAQFVGAAHGDLDTVKRMLRETASPQEKDALLNGVSPETNESAIQAAARANQREIVMFLLSQGASGDIFVFAMLGDEKRVDAMLQAEPSLAHAKGARDLPLLYFACLSGNLDIPEMLLSYDAADGKEISLHAAVLSGQSEMVTWLLANGVSDVNTPNDDGKTPLTVALEKGYFEIADMLQSEGGVES
jgi:ankyrin repeat protein